MKRLLAFLSAGALCMSLAACGAKDNSDTKKVSSKYDDLIEMLEDEDYEDAIKYIRDLAGDEEDTTESTDITDLLGGDNESGLDPKESPLLSQLHGTWLKGGARSLAPGEQYVVGIDTGVSYKSYTFNADGTCLFDDKTLSWEPSSCTETSLSVIIFDGETQVFSAQLNAEGQYPTLSLNKTITYEGGYYMTAMYAATLFNPAHYEAVVVTQDNWQDYFEFTQTDQYSYNSFDEANGLTVSYHFSLKPEYFERISNLTCVEGALELDCTCDTYNVTVDYENNSYTIGERSDIQFITVIGGGEGDSTYTLGLGGTDNSFYGVTYASGTLYDNTIIYPTDIQVVRLQVTLYLTK